MPAKSPPVWVRMEPELRERVQREADLLYDGNVSMLLRSATRRFLSDLDEQRRRASEVAVLAIAEPERELVTA